MMLLFSENKWIILSVSLQVYMSSVCLQQTSLSMQVSWSQEVWLLTSCLSASLITLHLAARTRHTLSTSQMPVLVSLMTSWEQERHFPAKRLHWVCTQLFIWQWVAIFLLELWSCSGFLCNTGFESCDRSILNKWSLQMYVMSCVGSTGGRLTGPFLSFSLVSLALLTGINRVAEYRNHWSDVIAGQAIGGASAAFLVSFYLSNEL